MRIQLVAALLFALVARNGAAAQVGGIGPPVGTGIPLGAAAITAPGIQPLADRPTGVTARPDDPTPCPVPAPSQAGVFAASAAGCGAGANGATAAVPTSTIPPDPVARAGIPLGATEIGNRGVSAAPPP